VQRRQGSQQHGAWVAEGELRRLGDIAQQLHTGSKNASMGCPAIKALAMRRPADILASSSAAAAACVATLLPADPRLKIRPSLPALQTHTLDTLLHTVHHTNAQAASPKGAGAGGPRPTW
jgi:hypothetical protein